MGVQGLIEIKVSRKLLPSRGAPPCFVMNVRGSAVSLAGSSKCKPDVDMILWEGVVEDAILLRQDASYLNELIEYTEWTEFRNLWFEH